jgi:hypothetical protein
MTTIHARRMLPWTALLVALSASTAMAQATLSREQMTQFLLKAKITGHHGIPTGITSPTRLTLTDGTTTHDAAFSAVDQHESVYHFANGKIELNFVDSYKYTVAAYQLAELLGIEDMMPVTVQREWEHEKGSLSWYLDDVKFDEGQRLKLKEEAPDHEKWNQQMYRMRVFTQLVADTDRNVGNVIITNDWKLWMIDFTRAFRRTKDLLAPGDIERCDRALLEKMKALTKDQVAAKTKGFLGGAEIDPLLARRDKIVELVNKLVAEKGEAQVLY